MKAANHPCFQYTYVEEKSPNTFYVFDQNLTIFDMNSHFILELGVADFRKMPI